MAIEIVDFPIENGGSFHSYVNVYQRVTQSSIAIPWYLRISESIPMDKLLVPPVTRAEWLDGKLFLNASMSQGGPQGVIKHGKLGNPL